MFQNFKRNSKRQPGAGISSSTTLSTPVIQDCLALDCWTHWNAHIRDLDNAVAQLQEFIRLTLPPAPSVIT